MDTALMLRLRQALTLIETDLKTVLASLATLAKDHAALPMPARTYGQHATPTSFGSLVANWGSPLLALLQELPELRETCLLVSLSGAAGTANALGNGSSELRKNLAESLNLRDPGRSWHTDRTPVLRIADWLVRCNLALGKLGEDCIALVQTGIQELSLDAAGASSTMPQKQNPVAPSTLVALARQGSGLLSVLHSSAMQQYQRDGAAWFTEWLCLPQIIIGTAAAAQSARTLCATLSPNGDQMIHSLEAGLGLIHAEALSFALAAHMPRPNAQASVKKLCREALETGQPLKDLVKRDHPELHIDDLFDATAQLGLAPSEAKTFAALATDFLAD